MLKWLLPVLTGLLMFAMPAFAQEKPADGKPPVHYSQCQAIAEAVPGTMFARFDSPVGAAPFVTKAALADQKVTITYIGHSTFFLQTPAGVTIATDYNGYNRPPATPMVATMNRAHTTHYSLTPDPKIDYVLHGWSDDPTRKADHHLVVGDTFIRNVTSDIRDFAGGMQKDGNSIFIFEVAGLCIGHLGHLHQELSEGQYAEIGRLDVLMVPVDGGLTMGPVGMSRVVQRLRASLILPMHRPGALSAFLAMFDGSYAVTNLASNTIEVSLGSLPKKPEILIVKGMQW